MNSIYWSLLQHKDWHLYITATSKHLLYVGSQNQPFTAVSEWVKKKYPKATLVENSALLASYCDKIIEYLEGKRQHLLFLLITRGHRFSF